jgi:hypothetical protein
VVHELDETRLLFHCHATLTKAEVDKACQVLSEVMAQCVERRYTDYRLPAAGQPTRPLPVEETRDK